MTPRIVCAGIAVLDRIYRLDALPTAAGKHFATSYTEIGGGPAATAAVAIARLGGAATLWSRTGADPAATAIEAELRGYGVDPVLHRCEGARSASATICIDPAGERQIVTFLDPALDPSPAWLPLPSLAGAAYLLADLRWPEGAAAALRHAAALGIPRLLDADAVPDPAAARPLLPLASHVIFSEPGLRQFTGEQDPAAGLRAARRPTGAWLAVTLGELGALSLEPDGLHPWPAFPVAAVDTTGAGDVFHGAFALALALAWPISRAMRFAAAAAACKCRRPGGRAGMPTRAEIDQLLLEKHA